MSRDEVTWEVDADGAVTNAICTLDLDLECGKRPDGCLDSARFGSSWRHSLATRKSCLPADWPIEYRPRRVKLCSLDCIEDWIALCQAKDVLWPKEIKIGILPAGAHERLIEYVETASPRCDGDRLSFDERPYTSPDGVTEK